MAGGIREDHSRDGGVVQWQNSRNAKVPVWRGFDPHLRHI